MTCTEPVLVMAFNRPDHLKVLIERLRIVQPQRIYLAVDGPRESRAGEAEKVADCQQLAAEIDWPCEVQTLFQENNLGCGLGVSTAISWFFEHEERGIILEDDIIPDPSFFPYCAELLERYKVDERVFAISGCNLVPPNDQSHPEQPYRFSQIPHIWGWATWRRSWAQHALDISNWHERLPLVALFKRSGRSLAGTAFWASTFELLARREVDTWDGQLVLAAMASDQLIATSNVNLTLNIGFGIDATHTVKGIPDLRPVEQVRLPVMAVPVVLDSKADAWTRKNHFGATYHGMITKAAKYLQSRVWGAS